MDTKNAKVDSTKGVDKPNQNPTEQAINGARVKKTLTPDDRAKMIESLNQAKMRRDEIIATADSLKKMSFGVDLNECLLVITAKGGQTFKTQNAAILEIFVKDAIQYCQRKQDETDILIEVEISSLI